MRSVEPVPYQRIHSTQERVPFANYRCRAGARSCNRRLDPGRAARKGMTWYCCAGVRLQLASRQPILRFQPRSAGPR
jgi:hypothetical protein